MTRSATPWTTALLAAAPASLAALLLLAAQPAQADISPPPDPVPCTVPDRESGSRACVQCDPLTCDATWGDSEYDHVCTFDEPPAIPYEVWCADRDAVGCHAAPVSAAPPLAAALLLALGGGLWWTRRR